MVLHRNYACEEHCRAAGKVGEERRCSKQRAQCEHKAANDAGHGIYLLAENERHLVDEHVAYHTAGSTGHRTHDYSHPNGQSAVNGLLYAHNGEQRKANGIKDEERAVHPYEVLAEYYHPQQGEPCTGKVKAVVHPEHGHVEHHVAQRTAAYGCCRTHHVGTEPVEPLCRCKANAAYGKGKRTHKVNNLQECDVPEPLYQCVSHFCFC